MNVGTSMRFFRPVLLIGFLALIAGGCGGGSGLSPNCDTIRGQFGNTGGGANGGLQVYVYSLTQCDPNGQNCQQQILVTHITTDSNGSFSASGLPYGNYLVRVYSANGGTLLGADEVNVPNVCYGSGVTQIQ